jgi:hypothetical protein
MTSRIHCRILIAVFCICAVTPIAFTNGASAASPGVGGGAATVAFIVGGAADSTPDASACEAELDSFTSRQYRTIDVHQAFGITTAGLLLAADGMGLYHFLQLVNRGHELRDRIGYTEESVNTAPRTEGVKTVWADGRSQTERVVHTGLIIAGSLSYATTATMKLTMPRTSKSQAPVTATRLHRYAFYLHAGLMAANIGLGLVESSALANGNHDLLVGAGVAHIIVGFSVPVVILGAAGIK